MRLRPFVPILGSSEVKSAALSVVTLVISFQLGAAVTSAVGRPEGAVSFAHVLGTTSTRRVASYEGRLPIAFEPNVGQESDAVRFVTRGAPALLTSTGAILRRGGEPLSLRFEGSSSLARLSGTNETRGKANYLVGDDPSLWRTNVPIYAAVRCEQLYANVDLVWYGKNRSLEFDLVVAAGADPGVISFAFDGAPAPGIEPDGALVAGDVRLDRPVAYQEIGGERRSVPSSYMLLDRGRIGFEIGSYDHSQPLIIDPEIGYTYSFADANKDLSVYGVAVDSAGAVYVAGRSRTEGPGGVLSTDVFVAKLNAEGTALVYATTIGGSASDEASEIAVDGQGNAYIVGTTESSNYPTTTGVFQPTKGSPNGNTDAFLTKLAPAGDSFVYSSFLGGSGGASGADVAVDGFGNTVVTGRASAGFPVTAPSQATHGGSGDAFVAKVNAAGTARIFSTYLGGSGSDAGNGIALDVSGNVYVVGETLSTNFPVSPGALQAVAGGGNDAFWAKYDPAGQRTVSTYLGGLGYDRATDIAVDVRGTSYLTGETDSSGFPVLSPFQASLAGDRDVFVTAINSTGTALVFSSYFGGSDWDFGNAIALDEAGTIYVVGGTRSRDLPVVEPVQAEYGGGSYDAFALQVFPGAPKAQGLVGPTVGSATYLGGSGSERGQGAAVTGTGMLVTANDEPKESTGGHDGSNVTQYVYSPRELPDLFVRILGFLMRNKDGERVLEAFVEVRSEFNCSQQKAPNAMFGLEIPPGLIFDAAYGKYGSRVVSKPMQGEPGVVMFALDRPVINDDKDGSDGGLVYMKPSPSVGPPYVQLEAFASTTAPECVYSNNSFFSLVKLGNGLQVTPGARLLDFAPLGNPAAPPAVSLYHNASIDVSGGMNFVSKTQGTVGYNVYASSQPGVQPVQANLVASLPADQLYLDVSATPPGSYFVVTTVTAAGESAPSNEVGGAALTATKLKVSSSKIVVQGSGFTSDAHVYFGGLPFSTAPKFKAGNTKVVQKSPFVAGLTLGEILDSLEPDSTVIVLVLNGNGSGVIAEYTK